MCHNRRHTIKLRAPTLPRKMHTIDLAVPNTANSEMVKEKKSQNYIK
jgi:hypothetical protein